MKRRHYYLIAWVCLLAAWIGYAVVGAGLARLVAHRFGGLVLRIGQGKFSDVAVFLQHRERDLLWLATLALVWAGAHLLLERLARSRPSWDRARWAIHGLAGFVCLNLFVGAAMNTGLYWGALGAGAGFQNLMQFHLKRILLEENPILRRAVLVGSSQTRAEIKEEILNDRLGTNLWTTELHYPGSQAYDLLLVERQIRHANPQFVICYLSAGYFYQSNPEEPGLPNLFGFGDLPDALHSGAIHFLHPRSVAYGLLGDLLPVFRCRDILAQRLLGATVVNLKQEEYDTSREMNLDQRAKEIAPNVRVLPSTSFQKEALERFVARCQQADRTVILLAGIFNPLLEQRINPAVRADLMQFLTDLKHRYSCVVLMTEDEMPVQTAADYEDLTHVNEAMQQRFSEFLAAQLKKIIDSGQNPR